MEQQIIDVLNQYVAENSGYHINDKALEQIHANEKSYDRLVNDQHYLMKPNSLMTTPVWFSSRLGRER